MSPLAILALGALPPTSLLVASGVWHARVTAAVRRVARRVGDPVQAGLDAGVPILARLAAIEAALPPPGAIGIASHRPARDLFAADERALLDDLRAALARDAAGDGGELFLAYQPKMRARDETIGAVEALLRWIHPARGAVSPAMLVALAESAGDIRALTEWVLRRAIADLARLRAAGHDLAVAINVSGALLGDKSFADWLLATLGDERHIGLEITETAVIDDPEDALANLDAFAGAGLKIAIDDYGSGLSSLAYLKRLPAHELKIDRLFVQGLTTSHRDPLLVRSTIDLAHALGMEVTAEGVENSGAFALLRAMGCDLIQGYLIARPMPLDALIPFLASEAHRAALAQPGFGWGLGGQAAG